MIDRQFRGELPAKPHTQLRADDGTLRFEHCLTRRGFDGPYTLVYRTGPPQREALVDEAQHGVAYGWDVPAEAPTVNGGHAVPVGPKHILGMTVASSGSPLSARVPVVYNENIIVSLLSPSASDPLYFRNGDGDDLFFVHEGHGLLRSLLGDVSFRSGDYLYVPKGLVHRFVLPDAVSQRWLSLECAGGVGPLAKFRNDVGQLKMDAPYSHRDFRRPEFSGPMDEGIHHICGKRGHQFYLLDAGTSPLDAVGWDGAVYPWAFSIHDFQPKVGRVHLPPDGFGTFATPGALVCSFVPRPVEWDPGAIPCPYPHSSVDFDELIYYVEGAFTSRTSSKVGTGSLTLHPAGFLHGPHPGAYEGSLGKQTTDEVAVMLDTASPLLVTEAGRQALDPGYGFS